jgi:pimeloyl-ACP methyl ester carboxylesterase
MLYTQTSTAASAVPLSTLDVADINCQLSYGCVHHPHLPLLGQDSEVTNRTAVPRQGGWQNKILGRFILEALGYNPSAHLPKIKCPVFFRVALQDHLCPAHVIREAAQKVPKEFERWIQVRDTTHLGAHKMGCQPEEMQPVLEFLGKQWGTTLRLPQQQPNDQQEEEAVE